MAYCIHFSYEKYSNSFQGKKNRECSRFHAIHDTGKITREMVYSIFPGKLGFGKVKIDWKRQVIKLDGNIAETWIPTKRALVIDDDSEILNLLQMALNAKGFWVEIAWDGEEGIKKYRESRFDLVITDLNLPKKNGNEVCQQIRNSNLPDTPVIGVSGMTDGFSEDLFDTVLEKPFPLKTLFDQIQNLIKISETQAAV